MMTSFGAVNFDSINNIHNNRKNLNVLQQTVVVRSNTDFNRRNDVSVKQSKKSTKYNNRIHNPAPVAVARRNARERNRVKQVNNGFATLQQHIPSVILSKYDSCRPSSNGVVKKLSKVETLRMAVEYIRSLEKLLASSPPPTATPSEGSIENHSNVDDFNFTDDSMSLSSQMHEDSNASNQYFEYNHNQSHDMQSPTHPNLAPLSTDDSLLIENNINFTQLINAPDEIILESESLYEPSFNNNNSNQNRNFVIMKPNDSSSSIVDCNGTNVIIWWQQQQQQEQQQLQNQN